tara:strand:+ start:2022 stop:2219 length:198 start_codon:yes stop_codon:yes gene_type:complete
MLENTIKHEIAGLDRGIQNRKIKNSECHYTSEINRNEQLLAYFIHPNVVHNVSAKTALKIGVKEI